MHNRFTITIHDINGVRQFNLHKIIKKIFLYAGIGLFTLVIVAVSMVLFLNNSLNSTKAKKVQMEHAVTLLQSRNKELQQSITGAEKELQVKQEELSVVSDRLHDIEEMIGLTPVQKKSVDVEIEQLTYKQMAALLKYIPSGSPVEYKGITSKFGYRMHPTLKRKEFHRGSDLRAAMKTPVYATADGVIEYAGFHKRSGYGRLIILDHNYGFKTYFGHLKKITVKSGQFVKKGELIAYSGSSGMSNGPHLHYEVRFIQRTLNPYWFIKWSAGNFRQIFKKEKKVPWQSLITAITKDIRPKTSTAVPPSSQKALLSKVK